MPVRLQVAPNARFGPSLVQVRVHLTDAPGAAELGVHTIELVMSVVTNSIKLLLIESVPTGNEIAEIMSGALTPNGVAVPPVLPGTVGPSVVPAGCVG